MSNRNERIMEEFNKLKNSKCITIAKCEFMNGDINNWLVAFEGSPSSKYEDGILKLKYISQVIFQMKDHTYILLLKCSIQI